MQGNRLGEKISRYEWAETESNRRHMDFQSIALPAELSAHLKVLNSNKLLDIYNKELLEITVSQNVGVVDRLNLPN